MKPVTVNARTFAPLPTMTNIEGPKVGLMYEVACVTPSASSPFFPAMTYILVTQIWIVLEAALIAAKASSSLLPIFALQGSPAFVLVLAIESMLCSSALRRILHHFLHSCLAIESSPRVLSCHLEKNGQGFYILNNMYSCTKIDIDHKRRVPTHSGVAIPVAMDFH